MAEADTVAAETGDTADTMSPKPSGDGAPSAKRGGRPSKSRGAPKSSDKGEDRWTIRGVPTNVRQLVLVEAGRRGLTLGDMVAEALVGYLKGRSAETGDTAANVATVPKPEELAAQVAQVLDRMTALERQRRGLWARIFG
jgi:hypothetical protein